jgi:type IV pilus assembly protein PilC
VSATTFVWKGTTPQGEPMSGEFEAEAKQEVAAYLRKRKIAVRSIRPKAKQINLNFGPKKGVSVKDMSVFTRQFSTMINAGLPIVQCLDILSSQTENDQLRGAISQVMLDVEGGHTLAESLAKHPKIFSDLYSNMVDAGEAGGILDIILARLAVYLEKADALQRKVKSAMTYPTIVATVAIGSSVFMLMFVIPVFAKMFTDFGGTLPAPTRIVMGLSTFLRDFWWLLGLIIVGLVFAYKWGRKTPKVAFKMDQFALASPVLGNVLRKSSVARFTRTLGTLVGSGVPILQGLDITARTAGNLVIEKAVRATRESISQGDSISEPLKRSAVFPPMVVQMIAVGEQTGALDAMLAKIADFYEDEVDEAVANLLTLMEPVMIAFLGVVIGGIVVSMYMPMFELISKIG